MNKVVYTDKDCVSQAPLKYMTTTTRDFDLKKSNFFSISARGSLFTPSELVDTDTLLTHSSVNFQVKSGIGALPLATLPAGYTFKDVDAENTVRTFSRESSRNSCLERESSFFNRHFEIFGTIPAPVPVNSVLSVLPADSRVPFQN